MLFDPMTKRQGTVNLVIHKHALEKALDEVDFNVMPSNYHSYSYFKKKMDALEEIKKISDLPNTKFVESYSIAKHLIEDYAGNAKHIVLYGCNRRVCLDNFAEELMKIKGVSVSLSIAGTA